MHGRHTATRRWAPSLLLVLVISAMSASAGAIGWVLTTRTYAPSPRQPVAASTVASSPTAFSVATSDSLDRCRGLLVRQLQVELAADAAIDQWRRHSKAMNRLLADNMGFAPVTRYWTRTRHGAHRKVREFRMLDQALRPSVGTCTRPVGEGLTSYERSSLRSCRNASGSLTGSLAAARAAIASWSHHIHDMDALLAGRITPHRATKRWLRSWRKGAWQVHSYTRQARQARHSVCR